MTYEELYQRLKADRIKRDDEIAKTISVLFLFALGVYFMSDIFNVLTTAFAIVLTVGAALLNSELFGVIVVWALFLFMGTTILWGMWIDKRVARIKARHEKHGIPPTPKELAFLEKIEQRILENS